MQLNDAGRMVESWWIKLNRKFPSLRTDKFVVMPNHFHGILVLQANPDVESAKSDRLACPPQPTLGIVGADQCDRPTLGRAHRRAPTLADVVGWFKTRTTNGYIRGVRKHQWVPFSGKLWQRGYFERIIRDENELDRIREYIALNPARWALDPQNPGSNPKGRP